MEPAKVVPVAETLDESLAEARSAIREIRRHDPKCTMLTESYWIERGNSDSTPDDDVAFAQAMYFMLSEESSKKKSRRQRQRARRDHRS